MGDVMRDREAYHWWPKLNSTDCSVWVPGVVPSPPRLKKILVVLQNYEKEINPQRVSKFHAAFKDKGASNTSSDADIKA